MYKSPKACYTKAPVRRETQTEFEYRWANMKEDNMKAGMMLVPGKANYVKEPVRG